MVSFFVMLVLASLVSLANQTQPMLAWTAFIGHTGATLKVIHAGVDQFCFARLPCLYASVNYSATFLAVQQACTAFMQFAKSIWPVFKPFGLVSK